MSAVPKQSKARARLAQHMDERRTEIGLRWADVATAAGLTTEGIRNVRYGSGEIRALTRAALERALRWEQGSISTILRGGQPTALPGGLEINDDGSVSVSVQDALYLGWRPGERDLEGLDDDDLARIALDLAQRQAVVVQEMARRASGRERPALGPPT